MSKKIRDYHPKEPMKKIVLNISDADYEKFRFEAILEKKSIPELIRDRVFYKPFVQEVIESFDAWIASEIEKIIKE